LLREKIKEEVPMANVIGERIERYGLYDLIEFLFKSELITKEEKNILDRYREKRNKIFHDLLKEMRIKELDKELQSVCREGEKIINNKKFRIAGKLVDLLEK
ncbi:unnamed protein product, partial [marine sediment metagenome]